MERYKKEKKRKEKTHTPNISSPRKLHKTSDDTQ